MINLPDPVLKSISRLTGEEALSQPEENLMKDAPAA
jgi:hypothetical protein